MPAHSVYAFSEKVALIADGANPIGRAAALQLALLGCYVIVGCTADSVENCRALDELKNLGTLANVVQANVKTAAGAKTLVGEVEKLYGRLDLLVNVLNLEPPKSFAEIDEADWSEIADASLKANFFIVQNSVELMNLRPKPAIVNVVSACDTPETSENVIFSSVNAALIGLTKSLAIKLAPKFRVNAVAASAKKKFVPSLDAELFKPQSGVAADDAARAIVYLLSPEATALNGQILTVG